MPRGKRKSEHYVNNKEFLEAIVIYRNKCIAAEEAGEPMKDFVTRGGRKTRAPVRYSE